MVMPSPAHRLIVAAFLMDLVIAIAGLGFIELAVSLDATPLVLGAIGMIGSLTYTFACLASGRLSDRYGRRRAVFAACLITATAYSAWSLVERPAQILFILPFSGLGTALFWPPLQAWLAELSTGGRRELNRNLGLFNIFWCAGLMLGPIVCGYLWAIDHRYPFLVCIAILGLILLIAAATPRAGRPAATADEAAEAPHARAALFLHLSWLGNFASFFAIGVTKTLFPKLGEDLTWSPALVGWLLAAIHFGQLLVFVAGTRTARWQYRFLPLLAGQSVAAVGLLLAYTSGRPILFALAFALTGLCAGATYLGSLFYSLHGKTESRGNMAGLHEAVLGSGVFCGPLLGGALADAAGIRAAFLLAACVYVLITILQVLLWRRERQADETCRAAAL